MDGEGPSRAVRLRQPRWSGLSNGPIVCARRCDQLPDDSGYLATREGRRRLHHRRRANLVVGCGAADGCPHSGSVVLYHCSVCGLGQCPSFTSVPYGPSETLTSTNGGHSWSLVGPIGSAPAFLSSISCSTTADCWAAGSLVAASAGVVMVTLDAGVTWTTAPLPTTPSPAQRQATGLFRLDIEDVSSVACRTGNVCMALGAQGLTASPAEQQIVLRSVGS